MRITVGCGDPARGQARKLLRKAENTCYMFLSVALGGGVQLDSDCRSQIELPVTAIAAQGGAYQAVGLVDVTPITPGLHH